MQKHRDPKMAEMKEPEPERRWPQTYTNQGTDIGKHEPYGRKQARGSGAAVKGNSFSKDG